MSWTLWCALGCLVNQELYEERRDALADADADGWSVDAGDCDDGDATVFPGAAETCDGVDQDCDGVADEDATDGGPWYADADGDGAGDPSAESRACDAPTGAVSTGGDCDDGEADAFPGNDEVPYDGIDNDCADGDLTDADGDGFDAQAAGGADCDDTDPAVHPDAEETWANGATDDDCDGERDAVTETYATEAIIGSVAGGQFGRRLAPIGDVDGDGIAELLVGALTESADADEGGAVYLVNGVDGTTSGDFPRLFTRQDTAYLGAVAGGVDVDGDGWPDGVAAASNADGGKGTAFVIGGAAFAETSSAEIEDQALYTLQGDEGNSFFGSSLAFLEDLDGDGVDELGVGAAYATAGGLSAAGVVVVWSTWELADGTLDDAPWQIEGAFESQTLGQFLQPAGDLDSDGYGDFLVAGAGELGAVLPGGLAAPTTEEALFTLLASEEGERCDPRMLGDVDGDGERDLGCVQDEAFLMFTNLLGTPDRATSSPSVQVNTGEGSFSFDMTDMGDLDGDGRAETLLPVKWHEASESSIASILFGDEAEFGVEVDILELSLRAVSNRPSAGYGYRSAVMQDTNGDGVWDIVLGTGGDSEGGVDAGGITVLPVPQ